MSLRSTAFVAFLCLAWATPAAFWSGTAAAEQTGTFKGSWIASGKRRLLDFAEDRQVFTFDLEGHVNLETNLGEVRDFWSRCVGLWDAETGGTTRCVWRDLEGNKVFSVLGGKVLEEAVQIEGELIGGTGPAEGIEGKFSFTWTSVFFDGDEQVLSGHTKDLAGSYRIP